MSDLAKRVERGDIDILTRQAVWEVIPSLNGWVTNKALLEKSLDAARNMHVAALPEGYRLHELSECDDGRWYACIKTIDGNFTFESRAGDLPTAWVAAILRVKAQEKANDQ